MAVGNQPNLQATLGDVTVAQVSARHLRLQPDHPIIHG
jgi:hypothetical protein